MPGPHPHPGGSRAGAGPIHLLQLLGTPAALGLWPPHSDLCLHLTGSPPRSVPPRLSHEDTCHWIRAHPAGPHLKILCFISKDSTSEEGHLHSQALGVWTRTYQPPALPKPTFLQPSSVRRRSLCAQQKGPSAWPWSRLGPLTAQPAPHCAPPSLRGGSGLGRGV